MTRYAIGMVLLVSIVLSASAARSGDYAIGILDGDGPSPTIQCAQFKELLVNFKWFHADAAYSKHTAAVRGDLMRFANKMEAADIRAIYKEGQSSNFKAQTLIDLCDDYSVTQIAYQAAEAGRLQVCGAPPPALSATCADATENIRWALMEGGACSEYGRPHIRFGVTQIRPIEELADEIRTGYKIAQGHKSEVFDSIDYIGDGLLIKIAKSVWVKYGIEKLPEKSVSQANPFAKQVCPGLAKLREHLAFK